VILEHSRMLPPTISIIEQIVAAHGCEKLPASYDSAVAHQRISSWEDHCLQCDLVLRPSKLYLPRFTSEVPLPVSVPVKPTRTGIR